LGSAYWGLLIGTGIHPEEPIGPHENAHNRDGSHKLK
jgi:hypothetical protein